MSEEPVYLLGEGAESGVYILLISVEEKIEVVFGRYGSGEPVVLSSGDYVYVGTARGKTLASRLLRHARRTGGKPVHRIESALLSKLEAAEIWNGGRVRREKRLRWHVDYLLDRQEAEIKGIIAVRTEKRLEAEMGAWVMAMPETEVFAPGLGASDVRGNTHLLRVIAGKDWWEQMPERLMDEIFDTI